VDREISQYMSAAMTSNIPNLKLSDSDKTRQHKKFTVKGLLWVKIIDIFLGYFQK
jgi:hypothetical protein